MALITIRNLENKEVGTFDLSDKVFNEKVNVPLVHQVLKAQLAGRRQGTAKTKTKAEVRGGGRKPYRQKGTGNARQGSLRTPLRPGGGQTFGPVPRSYEQFTPKEMIKGALRSVLTDRYQSERILVIDAFELPTAKTKDFNTILKKVFKIEHLLIVDDKNDVLERSARNIPHTKLLQTCALNVYDILRSDWLVISKRSIESIQNRLK